MLIRELKSIFYAFVAQDIEVYLPDNKNNCFFASRLVCSNCGEFWHPSLLQCFFCGEMNYYLYSCTGCGNKFSITKSTPKCDCNRSDSKIIKKCENENCISNTNTSISELVNKKKGVFQRESSFNISQTHCMHCGRTSNKYISYIIYVMNMIVENDVEQFKVANKIEIGSVIIYKNRINNKIKYDYEKIENEEATRAFYNPQFSFGKVSEVIDELF